MNMKYSLGVPLLCYFHTLPFLAIISITTLPPPSIVAKLKKLLPLQYGLSLLYLMKSDTFSVSFLKRGLFIRNRFLMFQMENSSACETLIANLLQPSSQCRKVFNLS